MIAIDAFKTRAALMEAAATQIASALSKGILERGQGFAALSGGGTPEPAYMALAALPLDWARVTFLMVDERFLAPTDPGSNEAMLRRALAPALAGGAKLLPMYSDGLSLEEAAARADALYAVEPIDIALCGMGGDGHTASWFPQSPELQAALDRNNPHSVIAVNAPGASASPRRLTLTRSALARADAIALLITGEQKRSLLLDQARNQLPVDGLFDLPAPAETLWAP
jgi:6-phosphogluconolactonase